MVAIKRLARKVSKICYYLILFVAVGRLLGDPELWVSDALATQIGHIVYGPGDIGADNYDDLYLYIHIITIFPVATFIYVVTSKVIKKLVVSG